MNLDESAIMETQPTEPAEVVAIEKAQDVYYVHLCIGKTIHASHVVTDEAEGICHVISNRSVIELPLAKNYRHIHV